jgi:hypothetical protein
LEKKLTRISRINANFFSRRRRFLTQHSTTLPRRSLGEGGSAFRI